MSRLVIYLLEDCEEDQYIFKSKFSELDQQEFRIQCFDSLADLATAIKQLLPDVLVTDLNLPDSLGLDTLIRVKKLLPRIPIVILTGNQDDIALKAIQLGAQDYLLKEELTTTLIKRTLLFAKERFLLQAAIEELAIRDNLTKLYNREAFDNQLKKKIDEYHRYGNKFALIFVDIDKFKPVNDEHGHLVGDKLLKLIADRLNVFNRVSDTVARIGGDEFVILASQVDSYQDLQHFIETKRQKLCGTYVVENPCGGIIELDVSMSFGGAIIELDGVTPEQIFQAADHNMYLAKSDDK